tara:strand:+ start:2012 stop:2479 length:468 start_codon:yes stop_codon:yes gene_type:complete
MKLNIFYLIFFAFFCFKSHSQTKKSNPAPQIVFNTNTSSKFTSKELNKLNTVYGSFLKTEILDRPTRVLAIKEILRNRVAVKEILDPRQHKPCPMLSEVPIFDVFVSKLKRDAVFNPMSFNPLKYDFEFHKPGFQMFRVDDSNYFIIIKPQTHNN